MDSRWSITLRPIKFKTVLGQSHVRNFFGKVLGDFYSRGKKLPVGFLFGGRSGVGKTTLARVVAASLNCPNRKGVEPCGVCESCQGIRYGKSGDVIEVDASFFGLVDNVRALRERLSSYSFQTYRVVILDECHMMSKESFNVLLKLLEEPPDKVVFILITTEVDKVLDTVRSRLVEFRFRAVPWQPIWMMTQAILKKFKITAEELPLCKLYQISGFNVRDYFMSLEYLAGVCDGFITQKLVEESFGDIFVYDVVLDALCSADLDRAISEYEKYSIYDVDFELFVSRFVDFVVDKLREQLRQGSERALVYSAIVTLCYKFLQMRMRLKGITAAKVLFFDIVSHLTKGSFGIQKQSKYSKVVKEDEIFDLLTKPVG